MHDINVFPKYMKHDYSDATNQTKRLNTYIKQMAVDGLQRSFQFVDQEKRSDTSSDTNMNEAHAKHCKKDPGVLQV